MALMRAAPHETHEQAQQSRGLAGTQGFRKDARIGANQKHADP